MTDGDFEKWIMEKLGKLSDHPWLDYERVKCATKLELCKKEDGSTNWDKYNRYQKIIVSVVLKGRVE